MIFTRAVNTDDSLVMPRVGRFTGQTHSRYHNHLSGTLLLNVVVVLRIASLLP